MEALCIYAHGSLRVTSAVIACQSCSIDVLFQQQLLMLNGEIINLALKCKTLGGTLSVASSRCACSPRYHTHTRVRHGSLVPANDPHTRVRDGSLA